jgi:superfamily II DNA helicase RecQ
MQHKSLVVAIIGIEAGKSMLFMLLALVLSRVIIVVVLLVALRFNIKEQCKQLGIISTE